MKKFALSMAIIMLLAFGLTSCKVPEDTNIDTGISDETAYLSEAVATPTVHGELYDFETEASNGETITSERFSNGKLIMINIWATWCSPCVGEIPELDRLIKTYSSHGLILWGVLFDSETNGAVKKAKGIMSENNADYLILHCNDSVNELLIDKYDVTSLPTTFFVDSNGNVIDSVIGAHTYLEWSEIVEEHLRNI